MGLHEDPRRSACRLIDRDDVRVARHSHRRVHEAADRDREWSELVSAVSPFLHLTEWIRRRAR